MTPGYTALRKRAAWLDLSARGKIRVTGEDRARLLHAMATNHIQQLKPGEGCYTFFLNAQGRILCDANILCFEDHFLIDTEPETRGKLYEHLDRYIIADDVVIEDQTDQWMTIALEGPHTPQVLRELGLPVPEAPYSFGTHESWAIARLSVTGAEGFFILGPAVEKTALLTQLSEAQVVEGTAEDFRVVRIENGQPRYGEEITERYLVQETGQLQAVHFSKGCYLGQEIVERVRSRAQIHRVLRKVEIDTTVPPPAGARLKVGVADTAEIASAVFSPALGKVVALAYVRIAHAEPGTGLTWEDANARVVGQTGH